MILYGSSIADAILTNACDMASATGGVETSQTSTGTGTNAFQELYSQGGSPASVTSIPATPTGHGWIFYPGPGAFAAANWSASIALSCTFGTGAIVTLRAFKYSGGTYTLIGTIGTITITGHPKTTYSFGPTSMGAVTTGASDGIYYDLWWQDAGGDVSGDNPVVYVSISSSQGVTNDMQITTSAFTSAATPSYTNQDASYQKFQVVKVYDPSGNFLGIISDATYITSIKYNIDAADDAIHIVLPRPIDAYDGENQPGSMNTIVMGNNVQVWVYGAGLPSTGQLKFNGIIDTIDPKLDENGSQSIDVLVTPYSQVALGDHAATDPVPFGTAGNSSTYVDTGVIFQSFFSGSYKDSTGATQSTLDEDTGQPYCYPFTLDPASVALTLQRTQYTFQNQQMFQSLNNILLLSPTDYFFRMNQNLTTFFGVIPSTPTHTLLLGQHITSIEFPQDNVPRKNVIVVEGKGVKGKYVGASVSTIGKRTYFKSDPRITDATTAQTLADGIGALLDRPVIRAKVKIPDYRGDQQRGLGYDIEKFKVGDTVKIVDARAPASSATGVGSAWGSFVWGQGKWGGSALATPTIWGSFNWGQAVWGSSLGTIFNTVVPICAIDYYFHYVELELGFRAPKINRKVFNIEAALADATLVS